MTYQAVWLADVLRAAKLEVIEEPGWQARGHGDMSHHPLGVLCHHTACAKGAADIPSLDTVLHGRPALPGPLCNLLLGRSGTWHCIAAGLAYHAGLGAADFLPKHNVGNFYMIGIEAENDGLSDEAWAETELESYARGCAAILKHLGLGAARCVGHKEYAPTRKIDPSFDMKAFRLRVAATIGTLS